MRSSIILCGGRSQRMGQDKGIMLLDDKPFIIHIIDTLEESVDEIILVLRDEEQLTTYKNVIENYKNIPKNTKTVIKLITDVQKDQGPLEGILTGLYQVQSEGALIIPCDSPFVSLNFVGAMFKIVSDNINTNQNKNKSNYPDTSNKYQAIVPIWPDGSSEPLHSYYSKDCIPLIHQTLDEGFHNVKSLFNLINVHYVDVKSLDSEKISFKNLNRPEDLL